MQVKTNDRKVYETSHVSIDTIAGEIRFVENKDKNKPIADQYMCIMPISNVMWMSNDKKPSKTNIIVHKEMTMPENKSATTLSVLLFNKEIMDKIFHYRSDAEEVYLIHGRGQDFIFVYTGENRDAPYVRITVEYIS